MKLRISLFKHKADNVPVPVERDWSEIVSKARRPPIRKEKDGALWSPAIFDPAKRLLKNVREVSALALDYDDNANFERDLAPWLPYMFVAHTTFSHTPEEQKFRVIIPLAEAIPGAEFPRLWKWASQVSEKKIDAGASDASRMFYTPGRRSETAPYLFKVNDGQLLDWRNVNLPTIARIPAARIPVSENGQAKNIDALLRAAARASNGQETIALLGGDTSAFGGDESRADLALANRLAFFSGPNPSLLELMMRRSRLERPKWDAQHYGDGRTYLQGVIDKALQERTEFYDFNGNGNAPKVEPTSTSEKSADAEERTTDLGNARRLVRLHQKDIRYCHDFRKWLIYGKGRWRLDSTGEAVRRAKATVQTIYKDVSDAPDDQRNQLASWAIRSESEGRIQAMLSLAESEPGIPIEAHQLDVNPMLLNCRNGTIDLCSGALLKHERDNYITKMIPVDYDPAAVCPRWKEFLDRIMAGNADLIGFLQRAAGYSLTGDVSERVLFILYGVGANGKSVFDETVAALLGDYAMRTPTSTLMSKQNSSIPNDVARLKGARFVHACESEEGKRLAESEIKDLTGGDTVSARYMRAEWFDFRPEFKLWLRTNHKPVVRGTDEAIWDRLKLIPFAVRIPKDQQDKTLSKKLLSELPGILAWAIRGCLDWQRNGLGVPEEVTTATEGYRNEMDSFAGFVEECCAVGGDRWVASKTLRECYESWGGERGDRWLLGGRAFTDRLKALGCSPQTVNRVRGWRGIGLEESI